MLLYSDRGIPFPARPASGGLRLANSLYECDMNSFTSYICQDLIQSSCTIHGKTVVRQNGEFLACLATLARLLNPWWTNIQFTGYRFPGPVRMLTLLARNDTKRGRGRPVSAATAKVGKKMFSVPDAVEQSTKVTNPIILIFLICDI